VFYNRKRRHAFLNGSSPDQVGRHAFLIPAG
jgi:hypothetical protein